ncbi:hypothetical protein D9M68_898650 [compost metagenome]
MPARPSSQASGCQGLCVPTSGMLRNTVSSRKPTCTARRIWLDTGWKAAVVIWKIENSSAT